MYSSQLRPQKNCQIHVRWKLNLLMLPPSGCSHKPGSAEAAHHPQSSTVHQPQLMGIRVSSLVPFTK